MTKGKKKQNSSQSGVKKQNPPKGRKSSLRNLMRGVGRSLGGYIAGPTGSYVGSTAADYLANIMGQGSYKVSNNTLLTNSGPPSFSTNGNDVIISNREYIVDVTSSTGFNLLDTFLLNPANGTTFPWLSTIATNFIEYEFLGLIVEFKPTAGSAVSSTNNALGVVMIATDYNVEDSAPSTKRAVDVLEFSTSTLPTVPVIHPIECKRSRNVLARSYTSAVSTYTSVTEPLIYFLGKTYVATQGMQAAGINIGEIWVSYQVRLSRPKYPTMSNQLSPEYFAMNGHYTANRLCRQSYFNSIATANIGIVNGYNHWDEGDFGRGGPEAFVSYLNTNTYYGRPQALPPDGIYYITCTTYTNLSLINDAEAYSVMKVYDSTGNPYGSNQTDNTTAVSGKTVSSGSLGSDRWGKIGDVNSYVGHPTGYYDVHVDTIEFTFRSKYYADGTVNNTSLKGFLIVLPITVLTTTDATLRSTVDVRVTYSGASNFYHNVDEFPFGSEKKPEVKFDPSVTESDGPKPPLKINFSSKSTKDYPCDNNNDELGSVDYIKVCQDSSPEMVSNIRQTSRNTLIPPSRK